jgi:hypothetical protein
MAEDQKARDKATPADRSKILRGLRALAKSSPGRLVIVAVYTVMLVFFFRTVIDDQITGSYALYSTTGTLFLWDPSLGEYLSVGALLLFAIAIIGPLRFLSPLALLAP